MKTMTTTTKTVLKYGSIGLLTLGTGILATLAFKKPKIDLRKQRIYLIGDSLAVGLKTPLGSTANSMNIPFGNTSKGGTAMPQWIQESWWQGVKAFNPTILLISLGTNDAYGFVEPDKIPGYIAQIKKLAGNARIYWIMPPKVNMKNIGIVRQKILETGVEHFDSDKIDLHLPDGVHPSGEGYQQWANAIWKALTELRVK